MGTSQLRPPAMLGLMYPQVLITASVDVAGSYECFVNQG